MSKRARESVVPVSRHIISRREREERYRRWLYIGTGIVAVLILGVLAVGLYQTKIAEPASPVATVNGKVIRTDTYQRYVQYQRYQIKSTLSWIQNQMAGMDSSDESQASLYSYLQQQYGQIQQEAMSLGPGVLENLINDELVRQEAARRGLTVTPDEVQKAIENQFGYNLDQPTPAPTTAPAAGTETATPAPTTGTETATTAPTTGAETATPEATPAATSTPAPTATPMTKEAFDEQYNAMLQDLRQNTGFTEADYRNMVEIDLLRSKLQDALAAEVPTSGEQVRVRHILLASEESAQAALDRIKAGEDFAAVAQDVTTDSTTKDQGGELGWIPRGQMPPEFEQAAFSLNPGDISSVVQSDYGYHIIQTEEYQADRPFDANVLSQRQSSALSDWLQTQSQSDGVKRMWDSSKVPPDTSATAQ